ncbi:hypothetical protein [Archangium sp.]|jgi:hypothetical protein|uniref:hypothetical protein n=1 Tax=Archangium sp. TaxID=1872627 RepID=UPI002ED9C8C5
MQHTIQPAGESWSEPVLDASWEAFSGVVPLSQEVLRDEPGLLHPDLLAEDDEKTDPWAQGACHFDLSREEWRLVRNAPLLSFLWVASADGQVLPAERRALEQVLKEGSRASSEVFRMVCGELLRKRDTLLSELASESMPGFDQFPAVYRLLAEKLGRSEAERFKWCLLEVGRRVGESSGGLFASWGWLRRTERQALAGLALALDSARTA